MMRVIGAHHDRLVFNRRARVLARQLADLLPENSRSLLDVGCGDGTIDFLLQQHRPNLVIRGVDVLVRPKARIPVQRFDGARLPFADHAFDIVMFADVLHHTKDPRLLLKEAKRVARMAVVVKDHTNDGPFAYTTLRFMDWVGNAHHGVALPYNYWSRARWDEAFADLGLAPELWNSRLGLYPFPASLVFERRLHFAARLVSALPVTRATHRDGSA